MERTEPQTASRRIVAGVVVLCLLVLAAACASGVVGHRTVTDAYRGAIAAWQARAPLYQGGYQYPLPFLAVFAPFDGLPYAVGETLWRTVSFALMAMALRRWLRRCELRPGGGETVALAVLLLLTGFDAMRNGQANVLFAALTLLGTAAIDGHGKDTPAPWRVATWLSLAVLVKPLGLATLLLAALTHRGVLWRSAVILVVALVAPYALAPTGYVSSQYLAYGLHLARESTIRIDRFADLNGLLRTFDVGLNGTAGVTVRALAGGVVAAGWLWLWRHARTSRPFVLFTLATAYLMLFNPMTEQNSYVIAAPWLAVIALRRIDGRPRPARLAWSLGLLMGSMTVAPELLRALDGRLGLWWHPAVLTAFLFLFTAEAIRDSMPSQLRGILSHHSPPALP